MSCCGTVRLFRGEQDAGATMVISDPTFQVIEDSRDDLLCRLGRLFRRRRAAAPYQYAASVAPLPVPAVEPVVIAEPSPIAEAEIAPALPLAKRVDVEAREIVLTADERRARAIALRGLCQSRGHRFEAARGSFVEAIEMDPALDLAKLPDFWRLPQGAHQAAIEAYEQVGRRRDAAALTAAVRSAFKPRLFRPRVVSRAPLA
jgi:hypothetical protein